MIISNRSEDSRFDPTDATEATTDTREYDAYGQTVSSTGSTTAPFGFVGKAGYQQDADSGLMLLGHRYYDASSGRSTTRGSGFDWGNRYGYFRNSFIKFTDSHGYAEGPLLRRSKLMRGIA